MVESFEELREHRLFLKQAHEQNSGFGDGLLRLLTDLYPDTAHFIYELLQNAEDMCATTARFILSEDSIEFEHNGTKRDFNLDDIDAITNIGYNIQKKEDPTSIGKFGVGFKAVFAYTSTPEIHSGNHHFRIEDFYVPTQNDVPILKTIDSEGVRWTKFILPFDKPSKSNNDAVREITLELQQLNDNSILFLRHIKYIEYLLPDGSLGYVKLIKGRDNYVKITSKKHNENREKSRVWLRFQRLESIVDDQGNNKELNIGVAYLTSFDQKNQKRRIVPVEGGHTTFIYFPAEKEFSGLRFNINAPFASTVARDSVRNCKENDDLFERVAQMVVDSLPKIKDMRLIDTAFLSVMPNSKDCLSHFYCHIRDRVYDAFSKFDYLPTVDGGYTSAHNAIIGSSAISQLFDSESLEILTGKSKKWVKNAAQRNSLEDIFIHSLNIEEFTVDDFFNMFKDNAFEKYLEYKPDNWLRRFYLFCSDTYDYRYGNYAYSMKNCRMFRSSTDKMCRSDEIFILHKWVSLIDEDTPVIKDCFISKTRNDGNSKIEDFFFDVMDIREYGPDIEAEKALKRIQNSESIDNSYFKDMLKLAKYRLSENYNPDIDFENVSIFLGEDSDDKHFTKAKCIVIGSPYSNFGSIVSDAYSDVYCLWRGYKEHYTNRELEIFLKFAKLCGATNKLEIIRRSAEYNPLFFTRLKSESKNTGYGCNTDYTIKNLEELLRKGDLRISKMIWQVLLENGDPYICKYHYAEYAPNRSVQRKRCDSSLICYLKEYNWVPDKNGKLFRPVDILVEDINIDFKYDENNVLLKALKFGEGLMQETEKVREAWRIVAEAEAKYNRSPMSLSREEEEMIWEKRRRDGALLDSTIISSPKELLRSQTKRAAHSDNVSDTKDDNLNKNRPNTAQVLKDIENTITNKETIPYVRRRFFTQVIDSSRQEKSILQDWYHGICQMCGTKIIGYNGKAHFVAKNIINTQDISRVLSPSIPLGWNSLSLCPNCAAKYLVCSKDITSLYDQILNIKVNEKGEDVISLVIQLDENPQYIQYNKEHFLALQEVFIWLDKISEDNT